MTIVDVAVIGRGLIGSAAARHLAEGGVTTALIGPSEVPEAERGTSSGPFSSHGDESRITRIASHTMIWSELAARSIRRYGDIEHRSQTLFHTRCGLAVARRDLDDWIDAGLIMGSNIHKVDPDWLRQVSGIAIGTDLPVAYEGGPAGYINPRRLLAAQCHLTEQAGGMIIDSTVTSATRTGGNGHGRGRIELAGSWGTLTAERVLIATGAFSHDLLGAELDLELRPRTVLMAEVADPVRLPCLIAAPPPDPRLSGIYWAPPVRYSDGTLRLKIGGTLATNPTIEPSDLVEWFRSDGDADEAAALKASLGSLLPEMAFESFTTAPCAITSTPTDYPYIGWVGDSEQIAVAIAGNGYAAKSSDEIGRLAASLFTPDGWTDSLAASLFTPQFI